MSLQLFLLNVLDTVNLLVRTSTLRLILIVANLLDAIAAAAAIFCDTVSVLVPSNSVCDLSLLLLWVVVRASASCRRD